MNNIDKIKETFKNDTVLRQQFIRALVDFEKKGGHPQTNVRDITSGPLADELFMGEKFEKQLDNGIKINFVYNSKIAREFLLSSPEVPNHVWEPQTTKLLLHFSKNAKNVIINITKFLSKLPKSNLILGFLFLIRISFLILFCLVFILSFFLITSLLDESSFKFGFKILFLFS